MLNKNSIPRPKRKTPQSEREIAIRDEHITLGQLLKRADIISTGGEAKWYLAETTVLVNGEPEQRRGRKLRPGDLIVVPDAPPVRLIASPAPPKAEPESTAPTSPNTRQKQKTAFMGDVAPSTEDRSSGQEQR